MAEFVKDESSLTWSGAGCEVPILFKETTPKRGILLRPTQKVLRGNAKENKFPHVPKRAPDRTVEQALIYRKLSASQRAKVKLKSSALLNQLGGEIPTFS
ncbi:hypothetical protein ILYODFUR_028280 [Ilyodon furcidens]|uniref:Uncharacterized protein n=1 Tax=Ilyodon furcidens TaxID=33524 RepID=A0ABV0UVZ2_9TELE